MKDKIHGWLHHCYEVSRLKNIDLVFLHFLSHFYFPFNLFFHFSIFRTLRLGLEVISHI